MHTLERGWGTPEYVLALTWTEIVVSCCVLLRIYASVFQIVRVLRFGCVSTHFDGMLRARHAF